MDREVAVMLTAVTGGLVALQAPINSHLGKSIGTFQTVAFSFAIGAVAMALLASLTKGGGLGQLSGVRDVSFIYLTGGLLGAAYVGSVLVTVRYIGLGGVTVATISAQLAVAVIVDHFGLLGVEKQPIDVARVMGVVLLAAGTYLVVRE